MKTCAILFSVTLGTLVLRPCWAQKATIDSLNRSIVMLPFTVSELKEGAPKSTTTSGPISPIAQNDIESLRAEIRATNTNLNTGLQSIRDAQISKDAFYLLTAVIGGFVVVILLPFSVHLYRKTSLSPRIVDLGGELSNRLASLENTIKQVGERIAPSSSQSSTKTDGKEG